MVKVVACDTAKLATKTIKKPIDQDIEAREFGSAAKRITALAKNAMGRNSDGCRHPSGASPL